MSDSATVYMVELNESMFVPLRNAILLACERYVKEYKFNDADVSLIREMQKSVEGTTKLSDLHNAGEGTLVLVRGVWFVRSSRYANCHACDVRADIINGAVDSIATMVYVTEICY